MSRFTLVSALVLSVVSAGLAQTGSPTVVRPPSVVASPPDGWWIRVDPQATTATRIDWQFGTTAKTLDVKNSWVRGGPDDLRISPPLQSGKALYIRATTTPPNSAAFVCVFFKQQGAGLFRFSGTEDRQVSIDTTEPKCVVGPRIYRVQPPYDVPPEPVPRLE